MTCHKRIYIASVWKKKYDKASAVIVSNKIKGCIEAWNNSMIKAIKVTTLT